MEQSSGSTEKIGTAIIQLFNKAAQELKKPKLHFMYMDQPLTFFRYDANHNTRYANWVGVSLGKYPASRILLRIDPDGRLHWNKYEKTAFPLETVICAILADPVGQGKMRGQEYKICCFCGRELTSTNSLHHGYGPICADNWGLPWEGPREEDAAAGGIADAMDEVLANQPVDLDYKLAIHITECLIEEGMKAEDITREQLTNLIYNIIKFNNKL